MYGIQEVQNFNMAMSEWYFSTLDLKLYSKINLNLYLVITKFSFR